jgi:signal transduction histidine kinase
LHCGASEIPGRGAATPFAGDLADASTGALGEARRALVLLETILEELCDGVLAVDQRGRVIYWSPSCERLTGRGAAAVLGRPADEALGGLAAELGAADAGPVDGLLGRGAGVPVRIRAVRASGEGGVRIGHVYALTDLRGAWEQQAEDERQAALAELGRGVAWAVHQIRNPLGAAAGLADLLARDLAGAPGAQLLGKVREGLREVDRRVGEILAYARPRPLQLELYDVTRMVRQVAGDVRARFPSGPTIESGRRAALPLLCDPAQLQQALENLLVNAAEAAGADGRVNLLVQRGSAGAQAPGSETVRLLIRNTGAELPADALGSVFEPFSSSKLRGTGLGLPLAKRIVEAHGGRIEALSAGGWTTFVVTLPTNALAGAGRARPERRASGEIPT